MKRVLYIDSYNIVWMDGETVIAETLFTDFQALREICRARGYRPHIMRHPC